MYGLVLTSKTAAKTFVGIDACDDMQMDAADQGEAANFELTCHSVAVEVFLPTSLSLLL